MSKVSSSLSVLDMMRSIEWRRSYQWEIKFPDAPSPFDIFFPATEYSLNAIAGQSFDAQGSVINYKFPLSTSNTDMTISILDSDDLSITTWLSDWYNEIYPLSGGVLYVEDAWRHAIVNQLSIDREIIRSDSLKVYPDQGMPLIGNSQSDNLLHSLTFIVVG